MHWTKWSWLSIASFLIVLFVAWILFSPELFGVSGCPILARLHPIQVVHAGETDYVELDRQPAQGLFPAFRVRVQGDGEVDWDGTSCVAATGRHHGQIDPQAAKALIDRFQARGFCRLCRNYFPDATDLGEQRFTLSLSGQRQDVVERSRKSPQIFEDLYRDVQTTARLDEWIGNPQNRRCGLR